jgi:hypothetical protein
MIVLMTVTLSRIVVVMMIRVMTVRVSVQRLMPCADR